MPSKDLVIGTAGHIDHGKTALVRALTGVDTDRLPAEKQRGITIDLGFAALDLGEFHLSLVDVPGHERFIRNMLAGATGLDLALLVVAADDSVMPQTREHLEILRLLGLTGGLIALTKCDLVDPGWLDLVEEEVRGLVKGSFLEGVPVVRTSARSGLGIEALRDALHRLCATVPDRADPGPFRLAIDRSFTVAGHGTVVTGTVASGRVTVGDELEWLPLGRTVRVRGLQRHDRPVERIERGSRAALNLVGVHHTEIVRGQELATPGYLVATRSLSTELRVSHDAPRPVRHRGRYRIHLGTAEVTAAVSLLGANELGPGQSCVAQFFLAEPAVALGGQPFVLREESPPATLGGGHILSPSTRRLRRRDSASIARLESLRSPDPVVRRGALAGFWLRDWSNLDLCREAGLTQAQVEEVLAELARSLAVSSTCPPACETLRLPAVVVADLEERLMKVLGRMHAANPRQSAIPRAHVASGLPDLGNEALLTAVIDRLQSQGRVVRDRRTVAVKGYDPKLSQGERRLKTELAESIRAGGFSPPEVAELASSAGGRAAVVPELLALLRDEERVVEISPQLYLDFETAAELRRRVRERLAGDATMTMADLRDLLGTTRKYAVPIGEYLDRSGLTVRDGDLRRLGPAAAEPEPSPEPHTGR
ncbi:MAG: selenocysteine-specific translation elongation factor [Isosphaeraceae bacterium]